MTDHAPAFLLWMKLTDSKYHDATAIQPLMTQSLMHEINKRSCFCRQVTPI